MGANFISFPEWQSMSSLALLLVILIGFGGRNVAADEEYCSTNITSFLPPPYGTMKNMECHPLWNSFTIRVCMNNIYQDDMNLQKKQNNSM